MKKIITILIIASFCIPQAFAEINFHSPSSGLRPSKHISTNDISAQEAINRMTIIGAAGVLTMTGMNVTSVKNGFISLTGIFILSSASQFYLRHDMQRFRYDMQ